MAKLTPTTKFPTIVKRKFAIGSAYIRKKIRQMKKEGSTDEEIMEETGYWP